MATQFSPSFATPRVPRRDAVKRIHKDGAYGTGGRFAPADSRQQTVELRSARRVASALKGRRAYQTFA